MQTEIHHCAASHGATLYYEVTGQGHPLVLLHGNGEDSTYFEHQVPVFSQLYQVIAIDTRAHGRSTRGNAPLDFYLFADDVIAVLDDLGLQKAHILGFSDGGNIALHTVLKYPAQCDCRWRQSIPCWLTSGNTGASKGKICLFMRESQNRPRISKKGRTLRVDDPSSQPYF